MRSPVIGWPGSRRSAGRRSIVIAAGVLVTVACSADGPAASLDGTEIAPETIDQLHPVGTELDDEQRASSLLLVILHHLLRREASAQFGITPTDAEIAEALAVRAGADDDTLIQRLADQGVTRDRLLLEAELDVLRERVQLAFIDQDGPDVDIDAAYRTFIGVNSKSCVTLLAPTSDAAISDMETTVVGDISLADAQTVLGDSVESVDLGCDSPVQLPPPVQSVAIDGEVGRAYLSTFSDGTVYVAGVTSRDAPPLEDVMDEVRTIAAESQGAALFDEWAFGILRSADVTIDAALGSWEPRDGTGDVPTVVPPHDD